MEHIKKLNELGVYKLTVFNTLKSAEKNQGQNDFKIFNVGLLYF
jgi:hypothetical protein